jgi:hypothetical protein
MYNEFGFFFYLNYETKNNKKFKYSKRIFKSICILLLLILFLLIDYDEEIKKIKDGPFFVSEFKCPNNGRLKSLIFEIKNKSKINSLNDNSLYTKNLISSLLGYNFSFYSFSDYSREKTLVKLGFTKKQILGVYNLYVIPLIPLGYNHWAKTILKFIISEYQKINRYLNYEEYSTKSRLYLNYKEMKKLFPSDYNFMAETYLYPENKDEIILKFRNYKFENNIDNLWLLKPKEGILGKGISILKNIRDINGKYIISKFFNNPHLIRESKYDIRFHGLITGIKPMKLYLYNQGFVKISSVKYKFSNLNNKFSFITNVGFQKKSNKYKYPKTEEEIKSSNLWNLSILKEYFSKNGLDYEKLYEEIKDIFIKMVFSVRKKLIENIEKNNLKNSNFYQLLGFDILLDNNLKPILLDVNERCALHDDNAAEESYIYDLIIDTLNLIGVTNIETNDSQLKPKDEFQKELEYNLCELEKPRGGYTLIFPLKNNIEKYKKLYLNDIPSEDFEFWKFLL